MANFRYLAATSANEKQDGFIEAESLQDALQSLHMRGLYVIRIGTPSKLSRFWTMLNQDIALRSPLGPAELARLSHEWASLAQAGISIEDGLAFIAASSSGHGERLLNSVRSAVKSGMTLHEALGRFPKTFPPVYRALVQAGEVAGNLGPTLRRLGDDLVARRALAEEIRNALLYPFFLIVTATTGILVLLLVVAPNLEGLIGTGSDRLPKTTQAVLATSHFLRDYGSLSAVLLGFAFAAFVSWIIRPSGRHWLDTVVLKVPVIGKLIRTIETGRFLRTLGALLTGGVAAPAAMKIALETMTNRHMRAGLERAQKAVVAGMPMGEAVAACAIFGGDAVGLIQVGERTGALAQSLDRAATLHEARAARLLKALTAMLTPMLTIFFGLLAGLIVYAMLSTILSVNELAGT